MNSNNTLNNLRILNTRPTGQAVGLNERIDAAQGIPLDYPTTRIIPSHTVRLRSALNIITQCEQVIFLSANAARIALPLWPMDTNPAPVLCVGPATAAMVTEHSELEFQIPTNFTSDGLLESNALQHAPQNIALCCGHQPRLHLANTLVMRGMFVHFIFCYRRSLDIPITPIEELAPDIIVCTSLSGLKHLLSPLSETSKARVKNYPLLVVSDAMQAYAEQEHWIAEIVVSPSADLDTLINTLIAWHHPHLQ